MKKNIVSLILCLLAVWVMASCMGKDDEEEYTYASDAALTSFYVSGAKQYLHTLSSQGEDSIYAVSVTGSDYKFYIDQLNGKIYNPDSLPYGTNAARIVVSATTKNGGTAYLKNLTDDDSYVILTADSIDFSEPRMVRVLSQDGRSWRDYEVKVNVHQQDGDVFVWNSMGTVDDFQSLQAMRLVAADGRLCLFGFDGASTKMYQASSDGSQWTASDLMLGAEAWKNVVTNQETLFVLDGTALKTYVYGEWTTLADEVPVTQLIACGSRQLFGYNADGKLMASENGTDWTEETVDDAEAVLPMTDLAYTYMPVKTTSGMERIILAGNSGDSYAQVWTRMADTTTPSTAYAWTFVDTAGDHRYAAPAYANLTLLPYDGFVLATGLKDGALQPFLLSRDGGITWKTQASYPLPEGLATGLTAFGAATDGDSYIWIVDNAGEVWRGRLNRLGFLN